MQDARATLPRLRAPLVGVVVHSLDVGQVQQRRHGGLLGALAIEELARRAGQDDADRELAVVLGEGLDDFGDWKGGSVRR